MITKFDGGFFVWFFIVGYLAKVYNLLNKKCYSCFMLKAVALCSGSDFLVALKAVQTSKSL